MKKLLAVILMLALLTGAMVALAEGAEPSAETVDRFCDVWVDEDMAVEIWYDEEGSAFYCSAVQGNGDGPSMIWVYNECRYDGQEDALHCEGGVRTSEIYDETAGELKSEVLAEGLSAVFAFSDGQDVIRWQDSEGLCEKYVLKRLADAETEDYLREAAAFEGRWGCGRATLDIVRDGDAWKAEITWGNSASECVQWVYSCIYDDYENRMDSVGPATKSVLTYGEDGEVAETSVEYEDGQASFVINDAGKLLWLDSKENAGEDMEFEYSDLPLEEEGTEINALIEQGSFIVQIPVPDEDDMGWIADDMAQDPSVVKLYDADVIGGTFVARYDPAGDGEVTVGVRHYARGIACDRAVSWDVQVEGGKVCAFTQRMDAVSPPEDEIDPYFVGEWLEDEKQLSALTVAKNPEMGWDVEIVSAMTHGAYVFKATVYYDCDRDGFVYDKGKYWETPITDSDEQTELGEPAVAGATGIFRFTGNEGAPRLSWTDDRDPEGITDFKRADSALTDVGHWAYYTFEGSGVAIRVPDDFVDVTDEPEPGIFYNCGNDHVTLKVTPTEDYFADRDQLMEHYNTAQDVVRATQIEINGVEMVYVLFSRDDARMCSVISPEGTTYQFEFLPADEEGEMQAQTMIESICSSADIPWEDQ